MAEIETRNRTVAAEALDAVQGYLASGDVHQARLSLDAARWLPGVADPVIATRIEALSADLARLERLVEPAAAYESARERGDAVAARHHARRAAALADGEEAQRWSALATQCGARIRAEWRINEAEVDLDAEAVLVDCAGLITCVDPVPARLLSEGGTALVLVSAHGPWVFIREVDLEHWRLRRIGWLRVPEPVKSWVSTHVEEDVIHLVAANGLVLRLSWRPLDVLARTSLRPFMLPDRDVSDAYLVPPGRYVWAELKDPTEEGSLCVVDLEERRVCRRPPVDDFYPILGSDPARLLGTRLFEVSSEMYDASGARENWQAPPGDIHAAAAHPSGAAWVALVTEPNADFGSDGAGNDGDDDGEESLVLYEMRPGRSSSRITLARTYEGAQTTLSVSLDLRLVFVLAAISGGKRLFACRSGGDRLQIVWTIEVPSRSMIIADGHGRRAVLLFLSDRGLSFVVLGGEPPVLPPTVDFGELDVMRFDERFQVSAGALGAMEIELLEAKRRRARADDAERWAERMRREHRRDPNMLAELAEVLASHSETALAERIVTFAGSRGPVGPRLILARAHLAAVRGDWKEVRCCLEPLDPTGFPPKDAYRLQRLLAKAFLETGEPAMAYERFVACVGVDSSPCDIEWYLQVSLALTEAVTPDAHRHGSALRRVIQAFRAADEHISKGDAGAALVVLDQSVVHALDNLECVARLAESYLGLDPDDPHAIFRKAVTVARFVEISRLGHQRFLGTLPGIGLAAKRLAALEEQASAWCERFCASEVVEDFPAAPWPGLTASGPSPLAPGSGSHAPGSGSHVPGSGSHAPGSSPPARGPAAEPGPAASAPFAGNSAPATHSVLPAGHETMRELVFGLDALVRDTVRYLHGLPGWDARHTIGEDLLDIAPVRNFLADHESRGQRRQPATEAHATTRKLTVHLDYCINFELHRRKLFFADASLAWMLEQTSLNVEGRALRLPFPCFGLVFTDRATLELAEAASGAWVAIGDAALQVFTAYVKQVPAPDGQLAFHLYLVFDARDGRWPHVRKHEFRFDEYDDLNGILDARFRTDTTPGQASTSDTAMRRLAQVILNAILYATSANVAWPLSQSPVRKYLTRRQKHGKKPRPGGGGRAEELRKRYSSEDVFYLPGRIPVSQLQRLQQVQHDESQGRALMTRFMVRGHWRRAAPGWRNSQVRWIEPYWKGPDLAAVIEKNYTLKI